MYRPTVLPRAEALSWWRDDRKPVMAATSAVGLNEVECSLCLAEVRAGEAPAPPWSANGKLRLELLWPRVVDHLIKHHGVVIEPAECPSDGI